MSQETAKQSMDESVAETIKNAQIVQNFSDKYGDKIPRYCGTLMFGMYAPTFDIHLGGRFADKDKRDSALSFAGDTFGRDGWTAEMDRDRENFDWSKDVDGVLVTIKGADRLPPPPKSMPVPPNKFPVQLADAKEQP